MRLVKWTSLAILAACTGHTPAPLPPKVVAPVIEPADPDAPLVPLDPSVRTGKLKNGLTYFIHSDPDESDSRIALAINVGSLDETEPQRGAAHLMLHLMAPIIASESLDADDFGEVTFDHTVISFTLERDDETAEDTETDRKLGLLRRCADGLKFDRAKLDAAREGIHDDANEPEPIPQEWTGTARATHTQVPGPDVFAALTDRAVGELYRTWYRPDQMAVIVTGNVDAGGIVKAIEKRFGSLPAATTPAPRHGVITAAAHDDLVVAVTEQSPTPHFEVSQRIPHQRVRGERGFRASLIDHLIKDVVVQRLRTVTPHSNGSGAISLLDASHDLSRLEVAVSDQEDVRRLLGELERVHVHGITQQELAAAMQGYASTAEEPSDLDALARVDALAAYFRDGTPYPGLAVNRATARLFSTVTLDEVNVVARTTFDQRGRVLGVHWAPYEHDMPTEATLRELSRVAATTPIEPWNDRPGARPLMTPPTAGTIVATKEDHGLTIWTLSNGARVLVRPTTVPQRNSGPTEVVNYQNALLYAAGPGGWSRLAPDAALQARFSGDIVLQSGLAEITPGHLRDYSREHELNLYADIRPTNHEVSTTAPVAHLESMFQLLHLAIAKPRTDPAAFAAWKAARKAALHEHPTSPYLASLEQLRALEGSTPAPPATEAMYEALDLDRALAAYRDHVGDMKGTTFVLLGGIDLAKAKLLVETYLASLGDSGTRITAKPRPVARPKLAKDSTVLVPPAPGRSIVIDYIADVTRGPAIERDLWLLALALQNRLNLHFGKEPRVNVVAALSEDSHPYLRVSLFDSATPTVGGEKAVAAQLELLRTGVIDTVVLDTLRAHFMPRPIFAQAWAQAVLAAIEKSEDPAKRAGELVDHDATTTRITVDLIKATARRFTKPAAIVRFEPVK